MKKSTGVRRKLYKQKMLPNLNNLPRSNEEGLQRVCKEKYAYCGGRISVTPDITPCEVKRLPEASDYKYAVFILRKRSPYWRIINYTMQQVEVIVSVFYALYLLGIVQLFHGGGEGWCHRAASAVANRQPWQSNGSCKLRSNMVQLMKVLHLRKKRQECCLDLGLWLETPRA